jgi:hypothetical protein
VGIGVVGEDTTLFVTKTSVGLFVDKARTRLMGALICSIDVVPLTGYPASNLLVREAIFGLATMERTTPHWVDTIRQCLAGFVAQTQEVLLIAFAAVAIMPVLIWLEI